MNNPATNIAQIANFDPPNRSPRMPVKSIGINISVIGFKELIRVPIYSEEINSLSEKVGEL